MTVTVRLQGGLGNQLFQLAFAQALHNVHGVDYLLDAGPLAVRRTGVTQRDLHLERIPAAVGKICHSKFVRLGSLLMRTPFSRVKPFRESHHMSAAYFLNGHRFEGRDCCMIGYWQDDVVAKKAAYLRDMLQPLRAEHGSTLNTSLGTPVAVHIRRGDYISNAKAARQHFALPPAYYVEAMKVIEGSVQNPHFFVFSDDIEWSKANLPLKTNLTFVESDTDPLSDLLQMSSCSHFIIANSTYSWWAAKLNPDRPIIVAPSRWNLSNSQSHLLGPEMIVLPC